MQLWASVRDGEIEAALVTAIQVKKGVKYLLFLALGGTNLKEWGAWFPRLEKWAKEQGCTELRIYGRIGWSRVFGFDVKYTKMVREL